MQVFANLTGSIANVNVKETLEKKREVFHIVNFANFWVYGLASIGFIVLVNDFITVWIGNQYTLSFDVVLILALNFYMVGMQNAVWTFKGTFGLFKQGRWLVIGTAIINLVLSFLLGSYFGLFGILLSIAIARAITNSWYDPYVVFTIALELNASDYFIKYLKYLLVLLLILAVLFGIFYLFPLNGLLGLLFKLFLCFVIPNVLIYLIFRKTNEMKYLVAVAKGMLLTIKQKIKR
jgi:O-antigen/teichoic acid export membrane protein